jgi:anti-sigma regulatory factor (Ser/Thr protein kinase)
MTIPKTSIRLSVPLSPPMMGLVTGFSEQAGLALGLNRADALKLTLASEEVFGYLTRHSLPDNVLKLEAVVGGYYAELNLQVPPRAMDLPVFNLTASPSLEDEDGLETLGLLIASRSVDSFSISAGSGGEMILSFHKEKSYPPAGDEAPASPPNLQEFTIDNPSPQQTKLASRLMAHFYESHEYPLSFTVPGKLVDMLACGEYGADVAIGQSGGIGGCLIWRWRGAQTVEAYGPYIFGQDKAEDMAQALVDACLTKLARTEALSLIFSHATEHLPEDYFELLGHLTIHSKEGRTRERPHYYRQLNEDPGAHIWTHPSLEEFLTAEYKRLFLPRELSSTSPEGEARPEHLVIGASVQREIDYVSLHPLWDGKDAGACLARHIKVLRRDGLKNILLFLDSGLPWSAFLAPDILDNGFRPRLVLPYGGTSDIIVFQHENKAV